MSRMLRLELVGILLLACTQILTEHRNFYQPRTQYGHYSRFHEFPERPTREVKVKQGLLRGMVVQPRSNHDLQPVDVFLGVPYAESPVGSLRFSPPRSPEPWWGVRPSLEFAPVCPQVTPKLQDEAKPVRYEYLEKLLPYLKNQSEDCLYLNIYAPHQPEGQKVQRRYPVIVFIHGESFEWNSGNPYDGTLLSAYGNVIVVTINFRLGILGFLRPGISDNTASNFGLLDQIAALLWIRENIAEFCGDPNSVTLLGHGTGAIFANLLLISPVANKKGLFKRAILMSGSALSADAIGKAPLQITTQVAHALNCPTTTDNDLALCLRSQDVKTLLDVKIHKPKYVPAFAPLIDNAVIPDKPLTLMKNAQLLGRFDLMYGVTESEKFHTLPPVELSHGMLDEERDQELRDHVKATHELEPEFVLSKILEQYGDFSAGFTNERATKNRDLVLDAISDSGTVAPLIMTANLHSRANPRSYMYVFSHPKAMQDYSGQQRQRAVHGEELPYVLGVPLDGNKYDLRRRYNIGETLFSEAMMNWWCSFAYVGNPNIAKRYPYLTDGLKEWGQYEVEWPEYDPRNQTYLNLTIPPWTGSHYRAAEMQFWNEDLPYLLHHPNKDIPLQLTTRRPRPSILDIADGVGRYANASTNRNHETYVTRYPSKEPHPIPSATTEATTDKAMTPDSTDRPGGETVSEPSAPKSSSVITMLTGLGVVFLLINFTAFLYLYCKKQDLKSKETGLKRRASQKEDSKRAKSEKYENHYGELGYKSDSKPDLNDVIKNDKAYDNNSNFGRRSKLSRQNSGSTIDTHIKVREWIQQEIVHRCSPRFLRKTRETLQREHQDKLTKQQEDEEKRVEEEMLKERKEEPIYDESPALIVRPGKKSKLPKVSVAVDATPAARTESILNQVPIELAKSAEPAMESFDFRTTPQVVVIEHHHSRSDPLPMENVLKNVKPNFSTTRIYESDSGSASSLYAKINPKLKSRLPRLELGVNPEVSAADEAEDTYVKSAPKLTTFAVNTPQCDINVTCREPITERETISPEEALRTIKRRNYPKVLPDIEKRRSLPAPSSLFVPKQHANSLRDYRGGLHPSSSSHQPPLPPPRMFGASRSLDFAEENENQFEIEPVTTNLHVGPLLRRQDGSTKNNSDPSIIDSLDERMDRSSRTQAGGSVDTIYSNPMCPVHGIGPPISQSMDKNIGIPTTLLEPSIGNPNWYKSLPGNEPSITTASSEPRITGKEVANQVQFGSNWETRIPAMEPRIVITPRVGNLLGQANQNLSQTVVNLGSVPSTDRIDKEPATTALSDSAPIISANTASKYQAGSAERLQADPLSSGLEPRKEPRIIIAPREPKASSSSLKQPKIIIKPTSSLQRTRDHRNIPKVSAIPSPEAHCPTISERQPEKPPLKEKPKVTRIPSFSRRSDDVYAEKVEIVQRVEAVPKVLNACIPADGKSSIPTLKKDEKPSNVDSSNGSSNTGTIKKKPTSRK